MLSVTLSGVKRPADFSLSWNGILAKSHLQRRVSFFTSTKCLYIPFGNAKRQGMMNSSFFSYISIEKRIVSFAKYIYEITTFVNKIKSVDTIVA